MIKKILVIIILFTFFKGYSQKKGAFTLRLNPKLNINNVTGARYGLYPSTFRSNNQPDGKAFIQAGFDAQLGYRRYLPKKLFAEIEFGKYTLSPKFRADFATTGGIYKPFYYNYHYGVVHLNFGKQFMLFDKNHLSFWGGTSWLLDVYKNGHIKRNNPLYLKSGERVEDGEVLLIPHYRNMNTAIFLLNVGMNYQILLEKRLSLEFGVGLSQGIKPLATDVVYFLKENSTNGQLESIGQSVSIANGQAIYAKVQLQYNIFKK